MNTKCLNHQCREYNALESNNCRLHSAEKINMCSTYMTPKAPVFPTAVRDSLNIKKSEGALDVQVGGDHYKNMVIQPIEYTHKNGLNFCQGNIIKYATRYKNKNGKEDLKKVIHYAELLIQLEYGSEK